MNLVDVAKKYIENGFSILPTKLDKSPMASKWKGHTFKAEDFSDVEGIGIKAGKESGSLEIIDIDNHYGDAKQTVGEFINIPEVKAIYDKYELPIESTQSGGFHLFYRCDELAGNKKLASRAKWDEKKNRFKPDCIIETRGEGGYVVAAPTKGYKLIRNSFKNLAKITTEERKTLLNHAKSFNEWVNNVKTDINESKDKPGDIYNEKIEAIEEMKGALKRNGWQEINNFLWRREGKKDGVSATIGKVAPNVFYCFTSNGYPFEPESGYKPFQVVGLLDYNGDFKKFAGELSDRYGLNKKPEYTKPTEAKEQKKDYESILNNAYIDLAIKPPKPPVILEISDNINGEWQWQRLFTLGNISAITGKAKSKKTFSTTMPMAALIMNDQVYNKFRATLPDSKNMIIKFDTEQGNYDAYIASKRVEKLVGKSNDNFKTFGLREFDPNERVKIIEYAIHKYSKSIAFVMIDGIADLVNTTNDQDEAVKIGTLLMKWSKIHNIHISTIIHQNKGDNYATGHLGSFILKKAECIISVEKDEEDNNHSQIKCTDIRGVQSFKDFGFYINEMGLPEIYDLIENVKESKIDPWKKDTVKKQVVNPNTFIEPSLNFDNIDETNEIPF